MKTTLKITTILLVTFFTISCSKDDDTTALIPLPTSDVFALGSSGSPEQSYFYKNNIKTILPEASNEANRTRALYVNENNVYIVGAVSINQNTAPFDQNLQACYWKNGVKVNLPHFLTDDNYAGARAITVVNNDVYVLGELGDSFSSRRRLVFWKNGVLNPVTTFSATDSYFGNTIYVFNNDVYVGGVIYGAGGSGFTAAFWKNGAETRLDSSGASAINDLVVNQNGVHALFATYAGGGVITTIKYWKDNVVTNISSQSPKAGKILVKGTDVYITGSERATESTISKAHFWKNGIKTELAGGNTFVANDIKMGVNGDLFIYASLDNGGSGAFTYWKNGVITTIPPVGLDTFFSFDINNK